MTATLSLSELAIVITAKNHNPTLLTPDFLKYSGIVPTDWELARPPLLTPTVAQVAFTNGINIVAQFNTITFSESLGSKALDSVKIPDVVRQYVQTLPLADYQGVGINPRSFLTFEHEDVEAASQYLASKILSPGSWQEYGTEPMKAALNLSYTLEGRQFNLSIAQVMLQLPESDPKSAVLFNSYFPYKVLGETEGEKREHLYQLLEHWQGDLEVYREVVNHRFLGDLDEGKGERTLTTEVEAIEALPQIA